jgi:hypothetical protein
MKYIKMLLYVHCGLMGWDTACSLGVTIHKTVINIFTAARISDLTYLMLSSITCFGRVFYHYNKF